VETHRSVVKLWVERSLYPPDIKKRPPNFNKIHINIVQNHGGLARVKALTKRAFPALFVLWQPRQAVMLWPPCVRCPRSQKERGPATSMALRRLALFKKSALATRDYSSPPIGFPDSQRLKLKRWRETTEKSCPKRYMRMSFKKFLLNHIVKNYFGVSFFLKSKAEALAI